MLKELGSGAQRPVGMPRCHQNSGRHLPLSHRFNFFRILEAHSFRRAPEGNTPEGVSAPIYTYLLWTALMRCWAAISAIVGILLLPLVLHLPMFLPLLLFPFSVTIYLIRALRRATPVFCSYDITIRLVVAQKGIVYSPASWMFHPKMWSVVYEPVLAQLPGRERETVIALAEEWDGNFGELLDTAALLTQLSTEVEHDV